MITKRALVGILFVSLTGGLAFVVPHAAHAATFTVTNTNDSGSGSLRAALSSANGSPGIDTINFNIAGSGVRTISSNSQLSVTSQVIIDGTSQSGYGGTPIIKIDGINAGDVPGIWITGGGTGSTIKGLAITRFQNNGIKLEGGSNTIVANYIGIDTDGATGRGNGYGGSGGRGSIGITSTNNTIGGTNAADRNIISGNSGNGIDIVGASASGNTVKGNFIGTNAAGTGAVPNSADGILVNFAPNNTIGGTSGTTPNGACTGDCNLFSGNGYNGIGIWNQDENGPITSKNNTIVGNYVGVNVNGTAALSNANIGIELNDTPDNTVGSGTPAGRNILSGNPGAGMLITGSPSSSNVVKGNYIGTDTSGNTKIANGTGINIGFSPGIQPAKNNTIGGTNNVTLGGACTGDCNLISGNTLDGIFIIGHANGTGGGNIIAGNYIGTNASGNGVLANSGDGIGILDVANNEVGGTNNDPNSPTAARNIISGNSGHGVIVAGNGNSGNRVEGNNIGVTSGGGGLGNALDGVQLATGVDTAVLGNNISFNVHLGIDLGYNGITQNDQNDPDGGVNRQQNFPNIYGARTIGGTTKIGGQLNSTPNTNFRLEFFQSDSCNAGKPDNFGEGQKYIGSADYSTDEYGNVAFGFQPPSAVPGGKYITATATKKIGSTPAETSEFSLCALVNIAKPALTNGASWFLKNDLTSGSADKTFGYGFPAALLMCAWDPNQPGVKLPVVVANNTWLMRASYTTGQADVQFNYGFPNTRPVCGDWNGDGVETPGIVSGDSTWFLRNSNSGGAADTTFQWGIGGTTPAPGDWNGDGTDTPGQLNDGVFTLRNSNNSGVADNTYIIAGSNKIKSTSGGNILVGDWDGNGTDNIGWLTPDGNWRLSLNANNDPNISFQYGFPGVKGLSW